MDESIIGGLTQNQAIQLSVLLFGAVVLLFLGERWWPRKWRQLEKMAWQRHIIFPIALGIYCYAVFLLSLLLPEPYWAVGRAGLLFTLWTIIPPICALLRERYWIRVGEWLLYLLSALVMLPELRQILAWMESIRIGTGEVHLTLASLVQGIVVLVLALYVGMGLARMIEDRLERVSDLSPSLRVLLGKIVRVLLLVIAGVAAIDALGVDITLLKFLGGGLGLGIGFGLQKVISNLFSGFILLADRSIKPGDVIEVDGSYGWINNLRARFVSVITRDGKEHLIPNEDLITHRVVNWSFSDSKIRVHLNFGVSYNSDVLLVRELALQCVAAESRILKDPAPVCFLVDFGDSSVDFQIRFWLEDPQNGLTNIRSAVNFRLWQAFKENGIEIPFPQRDLHLKTVPDKWHFVEPPQERQS